MITPRRLQHLLALVEHAHFGRAAEALNISQPALTKSIQGLETELRVKLVDRQLKGVSLTVFGDLVVKRGSLLLTTEEDLRREIASLAANDIGYLKVALGPYPSITSGYASLARLLAKHPKIKIAVHVASWREVADQVLTHAVDIGIAEIRTLSGNDQFATELIGQHRGHLFCRSDHPILEHKEVTLQQALDYPWVTTRLPLPVAAHLLPSLGAAGTIDPKNGDFVPAIELDVPMQLGGFLAATNALVLGLPTFVERELLAGQVVMVPTKDLPLQSAYGFIYLKNRSLPPAAIAYMQEIRAMESEVVVRSAELAARFDVRKK